MTDTLTPEVVAELTEAERAAAALREQELAAAESGGSMPDEKSVKLWHPDYEGFAYGPGRANADGEDPSSYIQFGPKAGLEPHVAVVPEDHPLLDQMLREYPQIKVLEAVQRVYLCPYDDQEFKTKFALKGHMGSHKSKPEA